MVDQNYKTTINYIDVIMSAMASQITGVSIVYSTVCPGADKRKHQSPSLLAFVRGIHRWPVNCPHKGAVTRKMFPSYDVIMRKKERNVHHGLYGCSVDPENLCAEFIFCCAWLSSGTSRFHPFVLGLSHWYIIVPLFQHQWRMWQCKSNASIYEYQHGETTPKQ